MKKTARKVSIFEIVWYSLTGALSLWGLTYIVLGIIARNSRSSDAIYKANQEIARLFKLSFLKWGMILFVLGVGLAIIVLLVNAKTADREVEKQQRRAARLAAAKEEKVEAPKEEVAPAQVEEKKEEPKEEVAPVPAPEEEKKEEPKEEVPQQEPEKKDE